MTKRKRSWLLIFTACAPMGIAGTVWAAQPSAEQSGAPDSEQTNDLEIIVTARKRSEALIDVPMAITALDPRAIDRYASTDLTSIGDQFPQVSIDQTASGSGATITIRGVTAAAAADASIESDAVVDIDGVPTTRGRVLQAALFDLSRVDVLKGPQALYYGKNSPAGAIVIDSAAPGDSLNGYARAGYETTATDFQEEAAIGGPAGPDLGIRLAVRTDEMLGGYIKDVGGPIPAAQNPILVERESGIAIPGAAYDQAPKSRSYFGRFTMVYKPADKFDATVKILAGDMSNVGDSSQSVQLSCGAGQAHPESLDLGSGLYIPDPYGTCQKGVFQNSLGQVPTVIASHFPAAPSDGLPFLNTATYLGSLKVNYQGTNAEVTSITGFYHYTERQFSNYDGSDFALVPGVNNDSNTSFTEEVRANSKFDAPVNLSAGAFYEHDDRTFVNSSALGYLGPTSATSQTNMFNTRDEARGETASVFAEIDWDVLPTLVFDGGARFSRETKHGIESVLFTFPLVPIQAPTGTQIHGSLTESNVSPQATLTWHPSSSTSVYFGYRTGFKSGGFSNPAAITVGSTADTLKYNQEKVDGVEGGFKFSELDGRFTGSAAAYRYTFNGLQVTAFQPDTTSFYIQNAGSSRVEGVELNLNYRLMNEISLRAGSGYNLARYESFPEAACWEGEPAGTAIGQCNPANATQNLAGRPLSRAPKWVSSVGSSWDHQMNDRFTFGLTSDVRYSSGYYFDSSDSPHTWQNGLFLVEASARVFDGNWEFAVIGKNISDGWYAVYGAGKPLAPAGEEYGFIGATYGLAARYLPISMTERGKGHCTMVAL